MYKCGNSNSVIILNSFWHFIPARKCKKETAIKHSMVQIFYNGLNLNYFLIYQVHF